MVGKVELADVILFQWKGVLKINSSVGCTLWILKLRRERWPLLKGLPMEMELE